MIMIWRIGKLSNCITQKEILSLFLISCLPVCLRAALFLFSGYSGGNTLSLRQDGSVAIRTGEMAPVSRSVEEYTPLNRLPVDLIQALLLQEDQDFFHHRGYSLREIKNSLIDYLLRGRKLRGASTITQQLARTLFLGRELSVKRKLLEIRTARKLEIELTKYKILELYLNHVYWGKNRYGIAAASRSYFQKNPEQLSKKEALFLVSLLPEPETCSNAVECVSRSVKNRMRRLEKIMDTGFRLDLSGAGDL